VGWRGGRRRSRPVLAAFFRFFFLGLFLLFVLLSLEVLFSVVDEATAEDAELELRLAMCSDDDDDDDGIDDTNDTEDGVYCENGDDFDVVILAIDSNSLCFHDQVPNEEDNDDDDNETGI